MNGLAEIRRANDLPQTKREKDYRVQRDRLALALRNVLAQELPQTTSVVVATEAAEQVLRDIYGSTV